MTTVGEVDSAAGGEDLEPLFDYKRVQPTMKFSFDDSDLEAAAIFKHCHKRPKVQATTEEKEESKPDEEAAAAKVVVLEEDWLQPPPPKATSRAPAEEDSTFRELSCSVALDYRMLHLNQGQLGSSIGGNKLAAPQQAAVLSRLKKKEWAQFAESAQDILQKLDETTNKEVGSKEPPEQIILDEESEPQAQKAREKIVISIQDKDGQQQMRVYKDEKFDKLLKVYAKKAKLNPSDLYFVFDGEKINPSSTPLEHDMEDEDMIEVRSKRS